MQKINIEITTEFIKLDSLLKFSGVTQTGGEAKDIIQDGAVSINGTICTMRGKKIYTNDIVSLNDIEITVKGIK